MKALRFPGPLVGTSEFQHVTEDRWIAIVRSFKLSGRQEELVLCIMAGLTTREIADAIGCAPDTVRTHFKRLYRKFNVHRREQIIMKVMSHPNLNGS